MSSGLLEIGASLALFLGMIASVELGRRLGRRYLATRGEVERTGSGTADSAVYGLLALLIGFAFSGAAARFDGRRNYVAQQVVSIGIAWKRIDGLIPALQPPIRDAFRKYVDALIATYTQPSREEVRLRQSPALDRAADTLWARAAAAINTPEGDKNRMLVLVAMTDMFGSVDRESLARRIHPPFIIFIMIGITAFAASLFAGFGMAVKPHRNWVFIIGVAATISLQMYVILELEFPRLGIVQGDSLDRSLQDLRARMK